MKKYFTLLILFMAMSAQAQNAKTVLIADSLTSVSLSDGDGWGGTPKAWTLQKHLNEVASNDDLVALARSHRNGAARAEAFRLLVSRGDSRYRDILYSSLRDTTSFIEQSGDIIGLTNVANYMVNALTHHWDFLSFSDSIYLDSLFRNKPVMKKKHTNLYNKFLSSPTLTTFHRIFTQKDSITLDSVLFFTPNLHHIDRLYSIIENLPADECYYDRLHQLYYDEGIADVLPALCRYRREADKAAVIECLLEYSKGLDKENVQKGPKGRTNQGLKAVAIWPDPAFLPALCKVRDYEVARTHYDFYRIRLFYLALMAYDNEISYNIIDETLRMTCKNETTRRYHLEFFHEAYEKSPRSRYESLLSTHCDSSTL